MGVYRHPCAVQCRQPQAAQLKTVKFAEEMHGSDLPEAAASVDREALTLVWTIPSVNVMTNACIHDSCVRLFNLKSSDSDCSVVVHAAGCPVH